MGWIDKFYENSWLRIMRHNSTTGYAEVNGTALSPTYSVADLTALLALSMTSADDNLIALVRANNALMRYDHSITKWVNCHPFFAYDTTFGTKAAPTLTVSSSGAALLFAPATVPTLPANLLRVGSTLDFFAWVARTSGTTAAPNATIYFGTAGNATDSDVSVSTLAATAAHVCPINPGAWISAATTITTSYATNPNPGSSNDNTKDKTTNITLSSALKMSVGISASAGGDTFSLLRLALRINTI